MSQSAILALFLSPVAIAVAGAPDGKPQSRGRAQSDPLRTSTHRADSGFVPARSSASPAAPACPLCGIQPVELDDRSGPQQTLRCRKPCAWRQQDAEPRSGDAIGFYPRQQGFARDTNDAKRFNYGTRVTAEGFQLPSIIDGFLSLGQYIRSVRLKSPSAAGSQFASLSLPGESCWR